MKKIIPFVLFSVFILFPAFSGASRAATYMKKAEQCLLENKIAWAYYYYTYAYEEDPENNLDALIRNAEIVNYIRAGDISLGKETLDDFESHDRWKKLINDYRITSSHMGLKFNGVSASLGKGEPDYDTRSYSYHVDISLKTSSLTTYDLYEAINEGLKKVIQPTWKDKEFGYSYIEKNPYLFTKKYLESKNYIINGTPFLYVKSINYEDNDKNHCAYSYLSFLREDESQWRNWECDIELVNSAGKVLASKTVHDNHVVFKRIKEKKNNISVRVKEIRFYYGDFDYTTEITKDERSFVCISDENFNKLKTIKFSGKQLNPESNSNRITITDRLDILKNENEITVYSKDKSLSLIKSSDNSIRAEALPEDFDYNLDWHVDYNQIKDLKTKEDLINFQSAVNEKKRKDFAVKNDRIEKISVITKLGDKYIVFDKKHKQVFLKRQKRISSGEYETYYEGVPLIEDIDLSEFIIVDFERLRDDDDYYKILLDEIENADSIYEAVQNALGQKSYPGWNEKNDDFCKKYFSFYDKKNNRLFSKNEIKNPENPEDILAQAEKKDSFILVFDEITVNTNFTAPMQKALDESRVYQIEMYYKYKAPSALREKLNNDIKDKYISFNTKISGIHEARYFSNNLIVYDKKIEEGHGLFKTAFVLDTYYPSIQILPKKDHSIPTVEELEKYKRIWNLKEDAWYYAKNETNGKAFLWNSKNKKATSNTEFYYIFLYEWDESVSFPYPNSAYIVQ